MVVAQRRRHSDPVQAILVRLEPRAIAATWPRIEQDVVQACLRSHGRYSAPLVRKYAEQGLWQIWLAINQAGEVCAVAGTRIVAYDTGLKALDIKFGTGRQRKIWQHFMADLLAWGKEQGCTIAEGSFRKGWRRVLPGWSHTHDCLERSLDAS